MDKKTINYQNKIILVLALVFFLLATASYLRKNTDSNARICVTRTYENPKFSNNKR